MAGSKTAVVALVADRSTARIVSLTASSPSIPTDSTTPSTIVATVKDAKGNSIEAGFAVSFTTSEGSLSGASFNTDANGQASVNLRATYVGSGSGTVRASVPLNSADVTVGFYADVASAKVKSLVASPTTVPADGTPSTLTATVVDKNENPLGAGITVYFGTDLNSLSGPSAVTNSSGVASVTIQGMTAGTANVTAKTTVSGNASTAVT
ncbi:Ig-like domain-containing protein, partial [Pseudomonas sp. LPH60]|uniref:Ig-like domain-containing protein n=1 Tax=Pseudomonas sp. LPH60 TaxID=3065906 RepID=UPI0035302766